jgi:hypothetical protein
LEEILADSLEKQRQYPQSYQIFDALLEEILADSA